MDNAPSTDYDGVGIFNATDSDISDPGTMSSTEPREKSVVSNVSQGQANGTVNTAPPAGESYRQYESDKEAPLADKNLFFRSVSMAASDIALSIDGEAYIEEIKKQVLDNGYKVSRLSNPGSFVIYHDKEDLAVPLVFQETLPHPNRPFKPYTSSIVNVVNDAENLFNKTKSIVDPLMITPYDYPKAKSMATSIMFLISTTMNSAATMQALAGCRYRVVTDQSRALSNLKQMIPNGILPHTQYAVSVEVADPASARKSFREEEIDFVPLFTVGGYTEFIKDARTYGSRNQTFTPLVNISACGIRYTSVALLPLIIRVAYNTFLGTDMWLSPFKHFNENEYNLGALALNDQGKPCFLRDSREFYEFVDIALNKPVLCVEVTGATMNYPALSLVRDTGTVSFLKTQLAKLASQDYGDAISKIPSNLVETRVGYYTGVTRYDGQPIDTRAIDYFKICRGNAADKMLLDQFLMYTRVSEDRIQAISNAGFGSIVDGREGVQSLYTTNKFVLSGDAVQSFLHYTNFLNFPDMPYAERGNVFNTDMLRKTGNFLNEKCYNTGNYSSGGMFGSSSVFGNFGTRGF